MDWLQKTKNLPKVWHQNTTGNMFNELNCGCMKSQSIRGCQGVNNIKQETGTR